MIMFIFKKNQKGMVLVLAVLIISVVLSSTAAFTSLIIREIQQSRLIDQSVQSYYLAESGSEKALYQLRRMESIIDCGQIGKGSCRQNGYCSGDQSIPCVNESGDLGSLGGWTIEGGNERETVVLLNPGQSFQLDLFNPYQLLYSDINGIKVERNDTGIVPIGEFTNLTSVLGIKLEELCLQQPPVFKGMLNDSNTIISAFDGQNIHKECSYSFRINYPFGSNEPLYAVIKVFDVDQSPSLQLDIPSRLVIKSSAVFGRSFQSVIVRTPMRPPLSGLYDFVLFSEHEIIK